ncbi:MAG: endolytic transglycosylase MltG [Pseudomonadota bacterium]|nr:endolytic transglycosylase MltG [Pseudomonadota bacterium]
MIQLARRALNNLTKVVLLVFTVFTLLIIALAFTVYKPIRSTKTHHKYVVKPGEGLHKVASRLHQASIVKYPRLFVIAYQLRYGNKALIPGRYLYHQGNSMADLIQNHATSKRLYGKFTIIEGWRWSQLYKALISDNRLIPQSPQTLLRHFKLHDSCNQNPNPCFEGQFLAGTYYFYEESTISSLLDQAHHAKNRLLQNLWQARNTNLEYQTPEQALIIASMVQRESSYTPEYSNIVSVILNRLAIGMPLQIDSCLHYGLNKHHQKLNYKDLKTPNEYNVYINKGLPPTPISMVSEEAIKASFSADPHTDYYYYVANDKGKHTFTKTHKDHVKHKLKFKQSKPGGGNNK